jgi:hypothetical protein
LPAVLVDICGQGGFRIAWDDRPALIWPSGQERSIALAEEQQADPAVEASFFPVRTEEILSDEKVWVSISVGMEKDQAKAGSHLGQAWQGAKVEVAMTIIEQEPRFWLRPRNSLSGFAAGGWLGLWETGLAQPAYDENQVCRESWASRKQDLAIASVRDRIGGRLRPSRCCWRMDSDLQQIPGFLSFGRVHCLKVTIVPAYCEGSAQVPDAVLAREAPLPRLFYKVRLPNRVLRPGPQAWSEGRLRPWISVATKVPQFVLANFSGSR